MSPISPGDSVVLVHGLWMNGLELGMLGHRLRYDHGFDVRTFSYPTLHGETATVCRDLADFASRVARDGRVHFVGHSLGGVMVCRMLRECGAGLFAGNAVALGSPLNGSKAALNSSRWAVLRPLLGPHVIDELVQSPGRWVHGGNPIGSIAGTLRMGVGQFFAHFDEANDGTVGVSETLIPGLADHLVLPHSHFGMLFAEDVALYVARFLRDGRFHKEEGEPGKQGTGK